MTLTEFLLARIAEDEARIPETRVLSLTAKFNCVCGLPGRVVGGTGSDELVVRHANSEAHHLRGEQRRAVWEQIPLSPEVVRGRADCEAKRRVISATLPKSYAGAEVDGWWSCHHLVLRWMALPYADHPDYREEWRPA